MRDTERFEKTALPHLDAIYRAALAMCGDSARAEDLTQATFVKALARFASFRKGTHCKAWLLRILRNTWIDELRHRKVVGVTVPADEAVLAADDPPGEELPDGAARHDLLEDFSDEEIIHALRDLPEEQRLAHHVQSDDGCAVHRQQVSQDIPGHGDEIPADQVVPDLIQQGQAFRIQFD